jgi:hypothetical protein
MWWNMIYEVSKINGLKSHFRGDDLGYFYGIRESGIGYSSCEWESFGFYSEVITIEQWAEATRGKSAPEFDPGKPFEVSHDGEHWLKGKNYIGKHSTGRHAIEVYGDSDIQLVVSIRNTEPFTAAMLKVGEYMVMECAGSYDGHLIKRLSGDVLADLTDNEPINGGLSYIKGRRVDVDLIVREV